MLPYNTMRYATDVFTFGAKGLAYCKTAFDFTACNKINSISVTGTESEDDNRGFVFHTGGKYYVLDDNGNLVEISVGTGTDNITRAVLSGNSAAQLNALTNVTSLAGKSVNLYIALSCPADATSKPSAKIAFVGAKVNRTLVKNVEFAAKTFNDKIRLTAVTPTITKTGNANYCRTARGLIINRSPIPSISSAQAIKFARCLPSPKSTVPTASAFPLFPSLTRKAASFKKVPSHCARGFFLL